MSGERAPRVSVCIPVYNAARFIDKTLASVFAQTLQDFEVVIVDNASTDDTPRLLEAIRDPRVRVSRNAENLGPVRNFNRAMELARGEYIKVLCADDLIFPECLERQARELDGPDRSDVVMVCCARSIIDERGHYWMKRSYPGPAGRVDGKTAIGQAVRRGRNVFGEPPAILVRRSAVLATTGFDPAQSYCVDLDFWSRILLQGAVFIQQDELCAFRVSVKSWSMDLIGSQYAETAALLPTLIERHALSVAPYTVPAAMARAFVNARLRQALYYGIHARMKLTMGRAP